MNILQMCHYPIQAIFQTIKELSVKSQMIKTLGDNTYDIYLNSLGEKGKGLSLLKGNRENHK